MLVIWGKKVVRRRLGRVAAFCPVCRGMACFRVVAVRTVSHVYYVPLGRGTVSVHEFTCEECRALYASHEAAFAAFSRSRTRDVVELAMETTPDLAERWGERLEMEDRLASLTPEERAAMIAEPFVALNYWVHRKAGPGLISTGAGLSIIGLVFLGPAAVLTWASQAPPEVRLIASGLAALCLVGAIVGLKRGPVAWLNRKAIPLLVRALAPLRPTQEEIQEALTRCREADLIIGKRLKAPAVAGALAISGPDGHAQTPGGVTLPP